ncbi:D-amino acid dehydrogenase small subunit [Cupriavidus taiwanensis]|uniref:D-amino acid dehydrogenase small subunit n=1 Tax=Cupriavidus taiwanensis TaxID=164546 RepID=A0A375CQK0_9BURK|nr:FAD-binding oxidoreductase [Cupriavidus taiwanensis]SOY77692.1 D-amino acid dehydrogenase small subunit [Cupriavidus taiwanensis]
MNSSTHEVVVIGGGIVGLSCAYYARKRGFSVTVVDPEDDRAKASYGNAGVLAACEYLPVGTPQLIRAIPKMLVSRDSPLALRWRYLPTLAPWLLRFIASSTPGRVEQNALALRSLLQLSIAEHKSLASNVDANSLLREVGWVKACETEQEYQKLQAERDQLQSLGVRMAALSSSDIDELAPCLKGIFARGTMFSDCMQIRNPGAYLERIILACTTAGVKFIHGTVRDFLFSGQLAAAALTQGRVIHGGTFVVAAGAWSKHLAKKLGENVYLDTERGYHAMLKVGDADLLKAPVLWHEKSVVLSQQTHGVRITSSAEFAGLEAPPRYDLLDRTVNAIRDAAPALAVPIASRWLGFRPSTPDSLPVLGRTSIRPNCFLAFGHGHLGLTLGPITGKLLAQSIAGDRPSVDLKPFSASRFNRF